MLSHELTRDDARPIQFTKLHVCGNDIILTQSDLLIDWSDVAKKICRRQFGIGGDQLVLVSNKSNFLDIQIYNPDGSVAPLCVNAILAAGYLIQHETKKDLDVDVLSSNNLFRLASTKFNSTLVINQAEILPVEHRLVASSLAEFIVYSGTNHYVVLLKDFSGHDLAVLGASLEKIAIPHASTNVMFTYINGNEIFIVPWERGGTGLTNACGSGAFSVGKAIALYQNLDLRESSFSNCMKFPGGSIFVEINGHGGAISANPTLVGYGIFFYEH